MLGRRLGDENTIFAEILASLSLLTGAHPLMLLQSRIFIEMFQFFNWAVLRAQGELEARNRSKMKLGVSIF